MQVALHGPYPVPVGRDADLGIPMVGGVAHMRPGPLSFEELLSHFPGPRKPNGQMGYLVNCSMGHDRETPSLSITPRGNGKGARFKCFGCNADRKEILEAAGLSLAAVLPARLNVNQGLQRPSPRTPAPPPARPADDGPDPFPEHEETRYEVRDVTGQRVRYHVRTEGPEGKTFRWEQEDGTPGLDGVKLSDLSLYGIDRLPPDGPVVITEGEKTADALQGNGIPAVGTVTGASGTPGDDALRPLLGRTVYLWPDNDDNGRQHMNRIGEALVRLGHRDVHTLNWEGAPPKGDAADLVYLEGWRDDFDSMLDAARKVMEDPFPEPVAGAIRNPTDFPEEVMTGLAGDFATVYSSHLEVPRHFFYMSFLTCLGTITAEYLSVASEITPQPRLYVLLLGESADDRKSTAITKTVDFFKWSYEGFPVCFGVGSAEGLQKRLETGNRLLLCFDELKQFISKCKIDTSVLLSCVNTLFESNRYESRTKTSEIVLESAHLSMLAASTIATYENTWSNQFTDIGFNNRLWLVPGGARRRFSLPAKAPEGERTKLRVRLAQVLNHAMAHPELEVTAEARALYHDWYMKIPQSIHSKRLDTYATRLMPLLAVNDLKAEIDTDTVRKAMALCDHQYHVRQQHDPIDADSFLAKTEEKIRRLLTANGPMRERDLKKKLHVERIGLGTYLKAKVNLQEAKEIVYQKATKTYARIDSE